MARLKAVLARRTLAADAGGATSGARLAWELRRLARRIGPAGGAGVAALALAVLAAVQTAHLVREQRALRTRIAALRAAPPAPVRAPEDPAARTTAFFRMLPAERALPDQLKELVRCAQHNGLALDKADYKPVADPDSPVLRYQIALPIKADAASVQRFIAQALHALPTLTLQAIAFKREKADTALVEVRIQFELLLRKQEPRA